MKLLMTYAKSFEFQPTIKTLEQAKEVKEGAEYENVLVAFIHAEEKDEADLKSTETKMLKNLKWAAGKNNTNKILLHSFAHLSTSKASPEFTQELFNLVEQRLKNANYEVFQTPFGYFLDLKLFLPGYSLARIFKEF